MADPIVRRPLKKPLYIAERAYRAHFPGNLRFPDFMGIGSGQAGSTWLFRNLLAHPRVLVPAGKETHYFDRFMDECSLRYYCSLFDARSDAVPLVAGEITPSYNLLRRDRIRTIRRLIPDVRLVLMIRNPVDRAWSAARNVLSRVASRKGCRMDELEDREFYEYSTREWAYRPERNEGGAYTPGMLQSHYCRAIDNWTRYFPQEQLFVGFFDEIKSDPRGLMERILIHIGADTEVDWQSMPLGQVVNRNPEREIPERFRHWLEDLYEAEMKELRTRFPDAPARWLHG